MSVPRGRYTCSYRKRQARWSCLYLAFVSSDATANGSGDRALSDWNGEEGKLIVKLFNKIGTCLCL